MPGWAKLPLDIFEFDINPTEAVIYALMLDISTPIKDSDLRKAQCRQSYICSKLKLSRSSVIRALAKLEEIGLIGRTRTGRADLYIITVVN